MSKIERDRKKDCHPGRSELPAQMCTQTVNLIRLRPLISLTVVYFRFFSLQKRLEMKRVQVTILYKLLVKERYR